MRQLCPPYGPSICFSLCIVPTSMPAWNVLQLQYQGLIPFPMSTKNSLQCMLVACHVKWITWYSGVMETLIQNLKGTCAFVNKKQWDFPVECKWGLEKQGVERKAGLSQTLCSSHCDLLLARSWSPTGRPQAARLEMAPCSLRPCHPGPWPTHPRLATSLLPCLSLLQLVLLSTMEKGPWTLPFSFLLPLLLATHAAQTRRCRRMAGHFLREKEFLGRWETRNETLFL